jgi:phosphohistidine phosphatase SixA
VQTTDALVPGAGTRELLKFLDTAKERRIVLVGHEPDLSDNVMEMVGLKGQRLELKKGGAFAVRLRPDGSMLLEWALSPRLLRKLTEE